MNVCHRFLLESHHRLALPADLDLGELRYEIVTPRFQTSSHVIFLVFNDRESGPVMAAKIPRQPGQTGRLEREFQNLQQLARLGVRQLSTVPVPIAFEKFEGTSILLMTGLRGETISPRLVRRHRRDLTDLGIHWLIQLATHSREPADRHTGWFARLVVEPLTRFRQAFPCTLDEYRLVDRTLEIADALQKTALPLVFEHGDLSHPNLIRLPGGGFGVLDWESGEPHGLPACDAFFYLAYVASTTLERGSTGEQFCEQTHRDFRVGGRADHWIRHYADRIGLSEECLGPLQLLTWARYTAGLLERLTSMEKTLIGEMAGWFRTHRYFLLWKESLDRVDRRIPEIVGEKTA